MAVKVDPFATLQYGVIPKEDRDRFAVNPGWRSFAQQMDEIHPMDERLERVLNLCLTSEHFRRSWEFVQKIYGTPKLIVTESGQQSMQIPYCEMETNKGMLKVEGVPKITLSTEHLYPAFAVYGLALDIFKLKNSNNDIAVLAQMVHFCSDGSRLLLDRPSGLNADVQFKINGIGIKITYEKGVTSPKFTIDL